MAIGIAIDLPSPGRMVEAGGDQDSAFELEGQILARMLRQLGVLSVSMGE